MKFLQLKRLEAYGFKSFADKLEIEFHEGVTAIVGPNGREKQYYRCHSLGAGGAKCAQSARHEAGRYYFCWQCFPAGPGGSGSFSDLDNADGTLSLDFQEAVVTRRLFRSGESEFYINKAMPLKDVYDLFADTGLG